MRLENVLRRVTVLLASFGVLCCTQVMENDAGMDVAKGSSALSEAQARVLGFESPTTDWVQSGGSVGVTGTVTEGSGAMTLVPNGWTVVDSIPLSTLSNLTDTIRFDVRIPETVGWGDTRVVLTAPSVDIYWAELGQQQLTSLPVGVYTTVSFPIPADVRGKLSGTYSDLQIKVILNAPAAASPYLFDHIVMTDGGDPTPVPETDADFSVVYPAAVSLDQTFMSATDHLSIFSQASAEDSEGGYPAIASFGPITTYLQAEAKAYANLYSVAPVQLDVKTVVGGDITTQGTIGKQGVETPDHPDVLGNSYENTPVPSAVMSWSVTWPTIAGADVTLWAVPAEESPRDTVLTPGAYGAFNVHDRNRVFLTAGTYYFSSFNFEPEAEVRLDTTGGTILIYVKSNFSDQQGAGLKGKFVQTAGKVAQALFGFLGDGDVFVQGTFIGTLVAPHALIKLERPNSGSHIGSFFGKGIEVAAGRHTVFHVPLTWDFVCPLGDSDGDGTFDCTDVCYRDPEKTDPLICGCGRPETDADDDGVPDCIDECPNDPESQHAGMCGCPSSPAPAGTFCNDAICGGQFVCDGAGRCGGASDCEVPGTNCYSRYFRDRYYWFCEGPLMRTEAVTTCRAMGLLPVQIDDAAENIFISTNMTMSDAWIGANNTDGDDLWRWAKITRDEGDAFWTGNEDGRRYFAAYSAWSSGNPQSGLPCAQTNRQGAWQAMDCTDAAGYVCEVPPDRLDGDGPEAPPICEQMGWSCDDPEPIVDCVDEEDAFESMDAGVMEEIMTGCVTECTEHGTGSTECQNACAALDPPAEGDRCTDDWADESFDKCMLKSVTDPLIPCDNDPTVCPAGTVCGRYTECADTYPCRSVTADPNDPEARASGLVCGVPSDNCPVSGDPGFPLRCNSVGLCGTTYPEQVVTDPYQRPGQDLTETVFDPETIYPAPEVPPEEGYEDQSLPCDTMPCNDGENHQWCSLGVPDALTDRQTNLPQKNGGTGGSLVSFNFDPNFTIDHTLNIGPFGMPTDLGLNAQAGFKASATLGEFAGGGTSFDIVEAKAEVDATRCSITADADLFVFETDFVPLILEYGGGENVLPLEMPVPESAEDDPRARCETAFENFATAANRAKKALRDALELIRQYKESIADDDPADPSTYANNFSNTLCETVQQARPRGFPPVADCATESIEDTINHFVEYYRRSIVGFNGMDGATGSDGEVALEGLLEAAQSLSDNSFKAYDKEYTLYDYKKLEEVTVFQAQFFIGPIPVSVELLAILDYGASVNLNLGFAPGVVVDQMMRPNMDDDNAEIAYVGVNGKPRADTSLALFAGIGISAFGVTAKVGFEGEIHIGEIVVPAYAGAGLTLGSELDVRPLPTDMDGLTTGRYLVPPKRIVAGLTYNAGLSVALNDILSGELYGKLKVSLLFFSKSWRKQLMGFTGICPEGSGREDFCDLSLIRMDGADAADIGSYPWGIVRPEMPFPELSLLATPMGGTPAGTAELDEGRIEELFYDSLCTCIDTPDKDTRECFRNDDCCAGICYYNWATAQNECSGCRADDDTCTDNADCCGGIDSEGNPYESSCFEGYCRPKGDCFSNCTDDDDCRSGLECSELSNYCFGHDCVTL